MLLKRLSRKSGRILVGFLTKNFQVNNQILFSAHTDFEGSSKAIYDYLIQHNRNYKYVWLVSDKSKFKSKKLKNTYFIDDYSFLYKYFANTSKYIFFEDGHIDVDKRKNQTRIRLNHGGLPIKNIKNFMGHINDNSDKFLCVSPNMKSLVSEQYRVEKEKLFICGLPRTDNMLTNNFDTTLYFPETADKKIIIWMPTFRKSATTDRNDSEGTYELGIPLVGTNDLSSLNEFLKSNNVFLFIKLHPYQDLSVISFINYSHLKIYRHQELQENSINVYDFLNKTDALITDYSSIYFDYLLLDKPIGFIFSDLDDYKLGLSSSNIEDYLVGHKMYDMNDLYNFIQDIANGTDSDTERRSNAKNYTLAYHDANNCKRLVEYFNL